MKIPRRALINGVLAVVIVAALAVVAVLLFKPFGSTNASATGTQLTSTVQQGTVSSTVSATGSIAPGSTTSVPFGTSGTIASVDVAVGQSVAVGQTLGTLDASSLQATVNADYQAYVYAGQDLTAAETQPNAQVSQINSAKLQRTQALNTYTAAKAQLAQASLTSPVAGLVIAVNGTVGASSGGSSSSGAGSSGATSSSSTASTASTSTSGFVTIADVSHYVVTANIAEADIANVSVGQVAAVTFPAMSGVTATAKVTAISPTATASNSVVTYATTITLDAVPAKVRLGQTAAVAITVATSASDALYVPAAAITTASDGTSTVKVVDSKTGLAAPVTVTLGVVGDSGTEIKTGLTAGETIVIGTVSASTTSTGGFGGTGTGAGTGTRGGFGGGTGGFGGGGTGGFGTRGNNG